MFFFSHVLPHTGPAVCCPCSGLVRSASTSRPASQGCFSPERPGTSTLLRISSATAECNICSAPSPHCQSALHLIKAEVRLKPMNLLNPEKSTLSSQKPFLPTRLFCSCTPPLSLQIDCPRRPFFFFFFLSPLSIQLFLCLMLHILSFFKPLAVKDSLHSFLLRGHKRTRRWCCVNV